MRNWKESLADMFWWNSKPSKSNLSHIELDVYKVKSWKIKIESKEHSSF